jgi:hypothetical protein
MKHGEDVVNLTEIYDFQPVITPEEFVKINRSRDMRSFLNRRERARNPLTIKANLLRGMVLCGDCTQPMSAGLTTKHNKSGKTNYFLYRCDTVGCPNHNKSVRAKVLTEFVYAFLETHVFDTKEVYEHYLSEMKTTQHQRDTLLRAEKASIENKRRSTTRISEQFKAYLATETDPEIKESYRHDIKKKAKELKDLDKALATVAEAIEKNSIAVETYERFLELSRQLPDILRKTKSLTQKDTIIRQIFSNFTAKGKKVLMYQLGEPYDTFVKRGLFSSCRGNRTTRHFAPRASSTG